MVAAVGLVLSLATSQPGVTARQPAEPMLDVIVSRSARSLVAAEAAVARHGGEVTAPLDLVGGFTARIPAGALGAVAGSPAVGQVDADRPVHVQAKLDQASGSAVRSVYRAASGTRALAGTGVTGAGVTIALIDTGVADVADVVDRVVPVTDPVTGEVSRCVDYSGEGHCRDSYGHGTFMAGILVGDGTASDGQFTGMAPGARVVSLKVAGRDGSSDVSKVIAAIQWTVANRERYGIRAVNLSLGTDSTQSWKVDPFNYAVERAWESGVVVTVSAANLGPAPGSIGKPGDDPWVMTVGAVDDRGTAPTGDDRLPDFSSRGPTADGLAKPDVVASGAHVVSLDAPGSTVAEQFPSELGDYRKGSGTSMATAVVSGGVALMLEAHPDWSPTQVKGAVITTAQPTATSDPLSVGAGMVDFDEAVGADPQPTVDLERSSGLGSLDARRGSVQVRLDDPIGTVLDGAATAQLLLWDPVAFTTGDWGYDSWSTTASLAHRWYGTSWYGDMWQGNNWQGNNWQGNNWQGDWKGSTSDDEPSTDESFGLPWIGAAWYGLWE